MFSFFCVVFACTAGSYYLLTSLLIPSVHPGTTPDARDPRTARFSQSTPIPVPFPPFMPFLHTWIKARNQSPRVLLWGWELRIFLACVQLSPPLKLSPRSLRGGGGTQEFTGSSIVDRAPVPGVQTVECGAKEEREKKNKGEKRERALTPTPSPLCLFVCLFFFCLHLLYAVPTIWTPGTG